ncbi:MAG: halocyanin, partial [Actinomycetota bacterium]|nr:halocyanin [Actinomycetota bacterium]
MRALAALTACCALAAVLSVLGADAQVGPCQTGDTPVSISGSVYLPSSAQVTPGTTVCWTNEDGFAHTVTSDTAAFDSGSLGQSTSFRHAFPDAGTFP